MQVEQSSLDLIGQQRITGHGNSFNFKLDHDLINGSQAHASLNSLSVTSGEGKSLLSMLIKQDGEPAS